MRARVPAILQPQNDDSERGAILILVALASVALIGMAALTLDVGYAYDMRSRLSASADAAAKAAAYEVWRGNSANYTAFAQRVLNEDAAAGRIPSGVTPTIRLCSDAGATCAAGFSSNKYVEVILARPQSTFLGGTIGISSLTPTARAVAGYSSSTACIITLGGSPSLQIGNSAITIPNCGVAVGGELRGNNPNSEIHAQSITASFCNTRCSDFLPLTQSMPPPSDPLASLPTPAACSGGDYTGSAWTPGCYNNVTLLGTATMAAGSYSVNGTLTVKNNASVTGNGVFLYLGPTALVDMGQHDTLALTAQTTGTYAGIAFFQDRSNTTDIVINNNSGLDISGAFYAPSAAVTIGNHMGNAGTCSLIVVKSLDIGNGSGNLDSTCTGFGGSPLTSIAMAE